jgi:NDP-sugar pyrophosphorylase family protein
MTSAKLPPVAILAGGLATRLRPLTERIPKSLVPVAGRPFLAHQLELLRSQGIRRAVLCVSHLGDQIETAFGDGRGFDIELTYSYDGATLAGTAGALRRALPLLGPEFFTLYGDSYLEIDYAEVWSAYQRQAKPALMTVIARELATEPANTWYQAGLVRAYDKRTPRSEMGHVDYGLSVFQADLVAGAPDIADLSDLQTRLAREGRLAGHEVTQRYFEIGSRRGLADLESHLRERS